MDSSWQFWWVRYLKGLELLFCSMYLLRYTYVALTVVTFYGVLSKYDAYVIFSVRKFLVANWILLSLVRSLWFVHLLVLRASSHRRRNRGAGGKPGPPQYFTLETLLIFIHAAQVTAIAVYVTFGLPKMELLPTPLCSSLHSFYHIMV